jgi:putative DNA methylase
MSSCCRCSAIPNRVAVVPLSLKDAPAIIERLLPVQKLSAEAYKEQMAVHGKTLTALGSYWKGRKPLILNKACVLGCLVPATDDPARDLEIFEKLMAMDDESFAVRQKRRPKPKEILTAVSVSRIADYFTVSPGGILPTSSPIDWSDPTFDAISVTWRTDLPEIDRLRLEAQLLPKTSYRERVDEARRAEEVADTVHNHIWEAVNGHLGTDASSFPDLVEQLGIMRYGHRPRVADTFSGSGQIPFEAARLGCDVYASDLSPIASMLTWGALNIIGGSLESRAALVRDQEALVEIVQAEIDRLGVEADGHGWRAKVYLYCVEVTCPQTGWAVPLLPTRIVSKGYRVVADLVPDPVNRRYDIAIRTGVTDGDLAAAEQGTVQSDGRGKDSYLAHTVDGVEHRTKLSTLRGDYRKPDGTTGNRLRMWEKSDFKPLTSDIFRERLYSVQWMRPKAGGNGDEYEFRSVTTEDLERERIVDAYVRERLAEWQDRGWVPDMQIEPGRNTDQPIRERGWTHWHHLFTARQLLIAGLANRSNRPASMLAIAQLVNWNSRLSTWNRFGGGGGIVQHTFTNQALNTLSDYGCRSLGYAKGFLQPRYKSYPFQSVTSFVGNVPADRLAVDADLFITDPPYGDAVRYEEILEFFIAWLRKAQPVEFAGWIWDSRRALAISGEDEGFRRGMVAAYRRMTDCMPDNGLQIIMFTHQSGSIWADMANIVWASGLHVTAAWYVVTETDSPLREGSYVKGTVLLVCRKRSGRPKTTTDELAWEVQEEVEDQVVALAGLNQAAKGRYRDENVFEDADLQMAGYAAALRVLTRYAVIDGRDMTAEAIRPRVKGETTFVDGLIAFAVDRANQSLVPEGIEKRLWDGLSGAERFYLKMLQAEARGAHALDTYQNFAKAFKVRDFHAFMGDHRANHARLKGAVELGRTEMSEGSELAGSVLRAVLYAVMELAKDVDGADVLAHITLNIPDYYSDMTQRESAIKLADFLARHLEALRPDEARAARVLRELVTNQRLG